MAEGNDVTAPHRSRDELMVRVEGVYTRVSNLAYQPVEQHGTVFCIHDFAGNANDFEPLANHLVAAGSRVVCLDMVGRGESACVEGERQYSIRTYVDQAMGVIESYRDTSISMIGVGWGGLIALLLTYLVGFRPTRLILSDILLDWSAASDPDFILASRLAGTIFPTRDAGAAAVLAYSAFANAQPDWALRLARNRLAISGGGFALALDEKTVTGMSNKERSYDILQMIAPLTIPTRLLWGKKLSIREDEQLAAISNPKVSHVEGLTAGTPVRFTTPPELAAVADAIGELV